ncbi:3-phosphoshikimate 1-carboxyvinyltransferase [candidate division NPL-UPA2 bacterium]|nr:3-phosphoshikimate 1-carboxyvinyltransferase [candidate division NPL-UPA2 bacterium]
MDSIKIQPIKRLKGELEVPGDKSISHRAVMMGALAEGITEIEGFLNAEDCLSTVRAFQALGVHIEGVGKEKLIIEGRGLQGLSEPRHILNVGNSGTTLRLLLGILAGQDFCAVLTGDDSLIERPMKRVSEPLQKMGAIILGRNEGSLAPLTIRGGRLKAIKYSSPIPSAQVKSAVLLAGLYAEGETSVTESVKSRDHTEKMLRFFGSEIKVEGLTVKVKGKQKLTAQKVTVPGDISSASFFLVAAAMLPGSDITITKVGVNPTRKAILEILQNMGAKVKISPVKGELFEPMADINVKGGKLKPLSLEGEMIPRIIDEIPIIAVAAALAEGKSQIRGASELRVKETDRIKALSINLTKLGAKVEEVPDGLIIQGGSPLRGNEVDSFGDHRLAMAMVMAGLVSQGETTVRDTDCINTSFPEFMDTLEKVMSYE